MKKIYLSMYFAVLLSNIQIACANSDLYTSDILSKGDADVTFDVVQIHSSSPFLVAGRSGVQTLDLTSEAFGFSYGLGNSWQVGLDLKNNSSFDLNKSYANGQTSVNTTIQGQQNSGMWAKYGIVDDPHSPFFMAGVLKIVPNITGKSTGFVIVGLNGGWDFGDGIRCFISYTGQFPQNPIFSKVNTVSVGATKAVTGNLDLRPNIFYSKIAANDLRYGTHQYGAGLTASLLIWHNTHLQASASAFQSAPQGSWGGTSYLGEVHGRALSVGIEHLF